MYNIGLEKEFLKGVLEMRARKGHKAGTDEPAKGTTVPATATDVPSTGTGVPILGTNVPQTSQVVPKPSRKRPKTSRKRTKASRTRRRKKSDGNRIRVPKDVMKYCNEIGINPKELVIWAYVNAKLNGHREMRGGG